MRSGHAYGAPDEGKGNRIRIGHAPRGEHAAFQESKPAGKPPQIDCPIVAFYRRHTTILVLQPFIGNRGLRRSDGSVGGASGPSASFAEAFFRARATTVILQATGLPFTGDANVRRHLLGERRDIDITDAIIERRNIL